MEISNTVMDLPPNLIKDNIKLFGIKFGKNATYDNYKNTVLEIKQILNKWENFTTNLIGRETILKTYVFSKMQYHMTVIDLPNSYIQGINRLMFAFL